MNVRDIHKGVEVYHKIFTHLGKGVVQSVTPVTMLESMFERGKARIMVKFAGESDLWRVQPSALRKTPNRRKIKGMIELYAKRGAIAKDGGDILILPTEATQ